MCGLCGVLGSAEHWSDAPSLASETEAARLQNRRMRRKRIDLANQILRHHGLLLRSSGSSAYSLHSKTGKQQLFDHFAALGVGVEQLLGQKCDPLDPALIRALEGDRKLGPAG